MPETGTPVLRPAAPDDAVGLVALCDQLGYPGMAGLIADRLAVLMADPEHHIHCAAQDGLLVGFAHLRLVRRLIRAHPVALLDALCIDREYRGRGIGTRLLACAEEQGRAWGCDRIELHSHQRRSGAHRFYESHGYRDVPRYYVKELRA
ncbi:MAG: GNAT family N-acetyltransferase [Planctomycetota bacterium]